MTATNPFTLMLAAVAGVVVGWAFEVWLVGSGSAAFVPSPLLGATLAIIALLVLVLAWQVRRYTAAMREAAKLRGKAMGATPGTAAAAAREAADAAERRISEHRVNPFRAVYTLALAKAASLVGSLFVGFSLGVLLFLGTRTVVGSGIGPTLVVLGGAVLLLVAGLLAEFWCRLPPQQPGEGELRRDPSATAG